MNGLERRIANAEASAGIGTKRRVWMVLDYGEPESAIDLAYRNAGIERREDDELLIIETNIRHNDALSGGPYPWAKGVR